MSLTESYEPGQCPEPPSWRPISQTDAEGACENHAIQDDIGSSKVQKACASLVANSLLKMGGWTILKIAELGNFHMASGLMNDRLAGQRW